MLSFLCAMIHPLLSIWFASSTDGHWNFWSSSRTLLSSMVSSEHKFCLLTCSWRRQKWADSVTMQHSLTWVSARIFWSWKSFPPWRPSNIIEGSGNFKRQSKFKKICWIYGSTILKMASRSLFKLLFPEQATFHQSFHQCSQIFSAFVSLILIRGKSYPTTLSRENWEQCMLLMWLSLNKNSSSRMPSRLF